MARGYSKAPYWLKRKRAAYSARRKGRAPYRRKRAWVKSNKQLTRAVKQLKNNVPTKYNYQVQNSLLVETVNPLTQRLTAISAGDGPDEHDGNYIHLRNLYVTGEVHVGSNNGIPNIDHPTRWCCVVIRSTLDTGISDLPSAATLWDIANTPTDMAPFDGFRLRNTEELNKFKIIKRVDGTLEPHTRVVPGQPQNNIEPRAATYPNYKKINFSVPLRNAKVEYRTNSNAPVNCNYYLMFFCESPGTSPNLGLNVSLTSQVTFKDAT